MFIRFTVHEVHRASQRALGVFHAIRYLRDDGILLPHEQERADAIMAWFSGHLARPTRFARSRRIGAAPRAIAWFKDSASEHIRLMRELAAIAEQHGQRVRVVTTARPGYVVYADQHQVVAEPFSDTDA